MSNQEEPQGNPLAACQIKYSAMAEADRDRLSFDIDSIIGASAANAEGLILASLKKAMDDVMADLTVNVWPDWIAQHSGDFEFLTSLSDQIVRNLVNGSPALLDHWTIKKLFDAWAEQCPEDLAKIADANLARRIASLEESLAFERSLNDARRY